MADSTGVYGPIERSNNRATWVGAMPPSILMSKFEETDIGPDEDLYDNYVRNEASDWRPDTNLFAHEEPRGAVNRNYGRLQLQYYGHRGDAETPYRPEIFDGFAGEEDRDPRGINLDPDMKLMKKQAEDRMRFIRFSKDDSPHITGGGRSNFQAMEDNQKMYRIARNRLKIFDRQLDGRTPCSNAVHAHKSAASSQVHTASYGDLIPDHSYVAHKSAIVLSKDVIRDTIDYRNSCADSNWETAKYSGEGRRVARQGDFKRVANATVSDEAKFADGDASLSVKAAGLLMANIVSAKSTAILLASESDADLHAADRSSADAIIARATNHSKHDLGIILRSLATDSSWNMEDRSVGYKMAAPTPVMQFGKHSITNHLKPAHMVLNADIIYKAARKESDFSKIKNT